MGFKGVADSSPAYSTMAWVIHFCKDWLKILEANKKTDRDPQRSVLEIIWIFKGDGSCEHVCINESACWGNHAQLGIDLFTSLGCFFLRAGCILRTWTIFRKMCDWLYETYRTWSGFAWISLSLCSVQTLCIYKRYRKLSVENNFVETLTW